MRENRMKVWYLMGVALTFVAPSAAFAHGPSRQKTTQTVEINAPAAKVWSVIGNFQDMSWCEDVAKTTGTGGNEPNNATRVVTLRNGGIMTQDLTRYEPKEMLYGYFTDKVDVKVLPVNDYSGTIEVKAESPNKSKVIWEAAFYRGYMNNDPPPELNDAASLKAVNNLLVTNLNALKKKIEATH